MLFSDSDLEDAEIQKAVTSKQKKGATIRQKKVGSRLTCNVIIIIKFLGIEIEFLWELTSRILMRIEI